MKNDIKEKLWHHNNSVFIYSEPDKDEEGIEFIKDLTKWKYKEDKSVIYSKCWKKKLIDSSFLLKIYEIWIFKIRKSHENNSNEVLNI